MPFVYLNNRINLKLNLSFRITALENVLVVASKTVP